MSFREKVFGLSEFDRNKALVLCGMACPMSFACLFETVNLQLLAELGVMVAFR